jgi:phosphopantetheine--protein transferase-like protein
MNRQTNLREIVARLCRVEAEEVRPDFSLAHFFSNSLNVHLLESALRKHLGIEAVPLHNLRTYSELEAAVLGGPDGQPGSASPVSEAATRAPLPTGQLATPTTGVPLACGLDVETISALPVSQDYWTHEFYTNTFTTQEIAYCSRQADPRSHFASRWCAKEALKKCDPVYLNERMVNIQVHHDENGAPILQLTHNRQILPYAVSMTHSGDTAAAVVVRCESATPKEALSSSSTITNGIRSLEAPSQRGVSSANVMAFLISVLSTLVAGLALLRTYGF